MSHPALRVEHLVKVYGGRFGARGVPAVNDLSFSVERGAIFGLLGPNGAGKTTAFYMIVGLVPNDAGRILIDDQDISKLPVHRRAKLGLGYLPPPTSLDPG